MIDQKKLEAGLAQLPLYVYAHLDPKTLEFSQRIRYICQHDCPMYGKTWACPPGVGNVEECEEKCRRYDNCLMIGTVAEVADIADITASLATRPAHEAITNQVRDLLRELGAQPYVLSTESCAICQRCAYLDGLPCRLPGKMHPCVESHGINLLPVLEEMGIAFQYGENIISWFSLLFY
ncbi:MAG TPA: DUF2284 domain-containing protein [Candidatus Faecousia intestinigallinarum]|nr:DUF2284 domain-containing protein [Candidatus Faecousia intestinigallinarum]